METAVDARAEVSQEPAEGRGCTIPILQTNNRAPRPHKYPTCSTAPGTSTKFQAAPLEEANHMCLLQSVSASTRECVHLVQGVSRDSRIPSTGKEASPGEEADLCQPA